MSPDHHRTVEDVEAVIVVEVPLGDFWFDFTEDWK
jgi:hypothetical protein